MSNNEIQKRKSLLENSDKDQSNGKRPRVSVSQMLKMHVHAEGVRPQLQQEESNTDVIDLTGASEEKNSSDDEMEAKEAQAEVVDISSDDEKQNVEDLQEASAAKQASDEEAETKEAPAEVIVISSEDENPEVERLQREIIQTSKKSTKSFGQDGQAVSKRKRNKSYTTIQNPANASTSNEKSQVSSSFEGTSQKVKKHKKKSKEKKKMTGKEKQKNKVKQETKKDGSDHDEIYLILSDSEEKDLLEDLDRKNFDNVSSSCVKDPEISSSSKGDKNSLNALLLRKIYDIEKKISGKEEHVSTTDKNLDEKAESKELDAECLMEVSKAISDDSQNKDCTTSIDKAEIMPVEDIPIRNEPAMQEVFEDEEHCSNAMTVSIASTEISKNNIDENAESKELVAECLMEVSKAISDDSQNKDCTTSIDKAEIMPVEDIPIRNEPAMQEVFEDEEHCSNAMTVSIASTEISKNNIDENAESKELVAECLMEVSKAISDDSQNKDCTTSIDKAEIMPVEDIPIRNEPAMQEVFEDEEHCSNAMTVSIASTEISKNNIDENAESKELVAECLMEVSKAISDDSQNKDCTTSIDKAEIMPVEDIPIRNEPAMQEVFEDEEHCSNAMTVSIASTEISKNNIDENAESKELDAECLMEVSKAISDDSQNKDCTTSIDKAEIMPVENIPIRNEPAMQEVFEDEEHCSNAKLVLIASTEHSNITTKDNAGDESKDLDAENPDLTEKYNTNREADVSVE